MKFLCVRGKVTIDDEGEAKITFIVSKTEAIKLNGIPTEELLEVEVGLADNETVGRV